MAAKQRLVVLKILSTDAHCNNECSGLEWTPGLPGTVAKCYFFDKPLEWNKAKKSNGYVRLRECVMAELQGPKLVTLGWLEKVRKDCQLRQVTGDSYDMTQHALVNEVFRLLQNDVDYNIDTHILKARVYSTTSMLRALAKELGKLEKKALESAERAESDGNRQMEAQGEAETRTGRDR